MAAKRRRTASTRVSAWGSGASLSLGSLTKAGGAALSATEMARLMEAAEIIATRCREEAAKRSKHAAASIRVAKTRNEIWIVAGGKQAPQAAQFENGAWHPVFARGPRDQWTWRKMPLFPFLEMGAASSLNEAADAFAAIISDWLDEMGV